jgi:hypothetical protein
MTTRAVHFEITEDQNTSSVLAALTRFANFRGRPEKILSDNQTSFVSSSKELTEFVKQMDVHLIKEGLAKQGIPVTWEFIPPRAPHFGGSWEIMVRAMKRALKVLSAGETMSDDKFRTVVSHATALLNSRPITRVVIHDKEVILTPNSFLIGNYDTGLVDITPDEFGTRLSEKFLKVEKIVNQVWKQFMHEILPELASRSKWTQRLPDLKPGTVVLVIDPELPRGQWKIGLVLEVKISSDGVVRSGVVRVDGKSYERPAKNLFPLVEENPETPSM